VEELEQSLEEARKQADEEEEREILELLAMADGSQTA